MFQPYLLQKAGPKSRFDVFLSPLVAHKALEFAFAYTSSDVHRQVSSYLMVEYHESLTLFRRI